MLTSLTYAWEVDLDKYFLHSSSNKHWTFIVYFCLWKAKNYIIQITPISSDSKSLIYEYSSWWITNESNQFFLLPPILLLPNRLTTGWTSPTSGLGHPRTSTRVWCTWTRSLGPRTFLVGHDLTIADLAVWGALKGTEGLIFCNPLILYGFL